MFLLRSQCHCYSMGGVSQPGEVTFSASGPWWVTAGLDLYWKLKTHFGCFPNCTQCNVLTHTDWYVSESNKSLSDCQMRRRALKLTLCLITLLSFPNTHPFFSPFLSPPSACAEMGRWSACQRKKVTPPPPFSSCSRSFQQQSAVSGCVPLAEIKSLMSVVVACFPWLAAADF